MTPQEKAKDLYDKFYDLGHLIETTYAKEHCKKCAIICVDEIIQVVFEKNFETEYYWHKVDYWKAVKTEIEKL